MNTTVSMVIDLVIESMLNAEYRRLKKEVDRLIDRNIQLNKSRAFLHNGRFFCEQGYSRAHFLKTDIKAINHELTKEVDSYIEDETQVKLDEALFRQLLFILLKNANSLQDCVNFLPDFVKAIVPRMGDIMRTKQFEECHSDQTIHQTNKLLLSMQVYAAGRLFY